MKKIIFVLITCLSILGFLMAGAVEAKTVRVNGYYRSNGTYVQPYYRTSPDRSVYNNWSTKGNYNLYTGKAGTKSYTQPLKIQPYKSLRW